MFLILTKDTMLLQAIYHLVKNDVIMHIQRAEELRAVENRHAKVIIDTLDNNIFHTSLAYQLEKIKPSMVYILSPFRIRRCFGDTPVVFVRRNVSLADFMGLLNCNEIYDITPELSLSRRQHQILTYILKQESCRTIAERMNITIKTYYCHKYNIMLLLKLRKMSHLMHHQISFYLR